jgi:hypothetical protein
MSSRLTRSTLNSRLTYRKSTSIQAADANYIYAVKLYRPPSYVVRIRRLLHIHHHIFQIGDISLHRYQTDPLITLTHNEHSTCLYIYARTVFSSIIHNASNHHLDS